VIDELREHAEELGCESELEGLRDLVEHGTGARRQLNWLEGHKEIGGLMREIIDASAPD
jgi:gamma-glutamyl:cysteine ligase YbdK (ATP-grasp superfamily)